MRGVGVCVCVACLQVRGRPYARRISRRANGVPEEGGGGLASLDMRDAPHAFAFPGRRQRTASRCATIDSMDATTRSGSGVTSTEASLPVSNAAPRSHDWSAGADTSDKR